MRADRAPGPGLSARAREALALALAGACLFAGLAMWTFALPELTGDALPRGGRNLGGVVGHHLAHALLFVFGRAAYIPVALGVVHAVLLFRGPIERPVLRLLGILVFTAMAALLLGGPSGNAGASEAYPYGAGGRLCTNLSPRLHHAFGGSGRILLLLLGALLALLLATDWPLSSWLRGGARGVEAGVGALRWRRPKNAARAPGARPRDASLDELLDDDDDEEDENEPRLAVEPDALAAVDPLLDPPLGPRPRPGPDLGALPEPVVVIPEPEAVSAAEVHALDQPDRRRRRARARPPRPRPVEAASIPAPDVAYPFPPLSLFREAPEVDDGSTRDAVESNARAIEQRLASFKIGARVVGVSQGPAVAQYEVKVADGVKVSRIVSYEPDLAAALKAVSVRVVAPIPGRDTVGVEVPNAERQMVVMRELLEQFGRCEDLAIPLFIGKDVAGEPIVEDLARMPHLLIAGTTGSGKSVCINAILLSVLMTRTPRQVRLILIDPKMVELQYFKAVPHLSCEVVTNMKKAPGVLEWAVEEMERRYALFNAVGVNHIRSYNRLGREEIERRLQREIDAADVQIPYQLLVIDELADLMATSQKEVEESIQRLAQKSRSVGLHVVLATQRPSTDVITGVIKANLPCQIAFKVSRKVDSRVILDANGAEKLLGGGDMLYVAPASHRLLRAQGAFVSDEEILRVVGFLEEHGPRPAFLPDLVQTETGSRRRPADRDDMYERAVEVVLGQQRGSATLLQRALAVGSTRATRLLEMMEDDGLVGPFCGSRSREVLIALDEWRAREQAIRDELARVGEGEGGGGEGTVGEPWAEAGAANDEE